MGLLGAASSACCFGGLLVLKVRASEEVERTHGKNSKFASLPMRTQNQIYEQPLKNKNTECAKRFFPVLSVTYSEFGAEI